MTSLERQSDNSYGSVREPPYNILSYTWGRWTVDETAPKLDVKGVTWTIPAVDENHFTVSAFQEVIEKLGMSCDYVWIDIACIDQEDVNVKMDEVGRQVGIFAKAQDVYIWLSQLTADTLKRILQDTSDFSSLIKRYETGKAELPDLWEVVPRLRSSIVDLFKDPWFSSLWTLQEGTLRQDACILSREGQAMRLDAGGRCRHFTHAMVKTRLHAAARLLDSIHNMELGLNYEGSDTTIIANAIRRAGYNQPAGRANPNIQYGMAQYRETLYPCDRIYGIMGIYDLQVGQDDPYNYTFEKLEHEFAATLNATSPFIGQLFLHTAKPAENSTWKITQRCRIPELEANTHFEEVQSICCMISAAFSPECHAMFKGYLTPFEEWFYVSIDRLLLVESDEGLDMLGPEHGWSHWFMLELDDYEFEDYAEFSEVTDLRPVINKVSRDEQATRFMVMRCADLIGNTAINLALKLFYHFGERLFIFLLGDLYTTVKDHGMSEEGHKRIKISYGVVFVKSLDSDDAYIRLGVCQWRDDLCEQVELGTQQMIIEWKLTEGLLF